MAWSSVVRNFGESKIPRTQSTTVRKQEQRANRTQHIVRETERSDHNEMILITFKFVNMKREGTSRPRRKLIRRPRTPSTTQTIHMNGKWQDNRPRDSKNVTRHTQR